jgi:sulfoxide reductase catalytic subunit YedY
MSYKNEAVILPSEITPIEAYNQRREFIKLLGASAITAGVGLYPSTSIAASKQSALIHTKTSYGLDEKLTAYSDVTTYNNYYEFGTSKSDPSNESSAFEATPWVVSIEGAVKKEKKINIEDLIKLSPVEERIYRMRCVEGWSMVVPWLGLPLKKIIDWAEPTGNAKYIEFISLDDQSMMPGVRTNILDWPYTEGLRMDEAMNPLTILAVGLYGKTLPNQNGAPLRLVVPWKYGFKGSKAIHRIRFTEQKPKTSWMKAGPNEYGFYANVNPTVDHPRWSQSSERRIGGGVFNPRIKTMIFNGYAEQVAHLYSGMDLAKNF